MTGHDTTKPREIVTWKGFLGSFFDDRRKKGGTLSKGFAALQRCERRLMLSPRRALRTLRQGGREISRPYRVSATTEAVVHGARYLD